MGICDFTPTLEHLLDLNTLLNVEYPDLVILIQIHIAHGFVQEFLIVVFAFSDFVVEMHGLSVFESHL